MRTMIDNAKIAKIEEDIKATDAKVKDTDAKIKATDAKVDATNAKVDATDAKVNSINQVPASTAADAGKVLTVGDDGTVSWQTKGAGGGMKAFFDARGKCGYSEATSFDGVINFGDTSDVTDMDLMFRNCQDLTSAPSFDTSKVTSMFEMFINCSNLTSVPSLDTNNVTNMREMFYSCRSLETIHMINISADLDISSSIKFTREALLEIIGNLKTVTSTKTLTMGSTNLAKLTNEDKAIARNKGWTLA